MVTREPLRKIVRQASEAVAQKDLRTFETEYPECPEELCEPYNSRRSDFGSQLYGALGINREDAQGRLEQVKRNFMLFNARHDGIASQLRNRSCSRQTSAAIDRQDEGAMPLASITRLRVRSIRYLPEFLLRALASVRQARRSSGCLSADVRREVKLVFWTRTLWQDEPSMRAFMTRGAHRAVMPKILDWCDEASVTHWQQDGEHPPDWPTAAARMRTEGRTSRVRNPSPAHRRGEAVPATATRTDRE